MTSNQTTTPDRIAKQAVLKASVQRVWDAISDAKKFGSWFGVAFDGPFVAGQRLTGKIVPTTVDPEVAKLQEPHAGKPFEFWVETITPMSCIIFRWHPFAIDPSVDYSGEPTTLIAFELSKATDGTQLKISESGFDKIPLARRAAAFAANDGGWGHQIVLLQKYLQLTQGD